MISFDGRDTSADYTSFTWMNPCYEQYLANPNSTYVIYWLVGDFVHCENGVRLARSGTPRYPVGNLMRVERLGTRCKLA